MAPADRVYSAASSWSPTKTAGSGSTVSDNSTLGPQSRAPGSASPRKFIVPKHSKPWHQNDTKVSTRSELIKSPTRGTTSPTKARSLTSSVRSPTKGMRTPLPGMVVDSWGREVPARKSKANTTFYLPKKGEQRAATPTSTSPTRTASPPKKTTSVGARPASPTKGSAKKKRPLSQAEKEQLEDERLEQLEREQEAREQAERSLNISARAEAARYARQVFADADRDGNGTLSKNEVRAYFKSHPEDREVVLGSSFRWKSIFARMDSDGDGKFTVVEFTRTVAGQVLAKKKAEARRAQLVELATKGKGFQASRKALFVEVDTDGDGNWSWVEAFKAIQSRWPDFDNDSACRMAFQASTRNGLNLDPREMRLFFQYQLHYDDAWETFNTLDEDEDGLITLTDIVSAPYKLGLKATDDLVSIFRAMCRKSPPGKNAAGENAVNLAEFSTWLGLNAFISVENKANRDDIERAFTASKSWWGKTAADWAAQDAAAVAAVEEAASAATARAAFLLTPEGQAQLAADRAAQEKKEEEDRAAAESKKAAEKVLAVQMEARAFAKALFAGADKDGNGTLSKTEVRKYFAANTAERDAVLGTSFQWKTFFASIDADGDGKFDVVEFTKGVVTRVLANQEAAARRVDLERLAARGKTGYDERKALFDAIDENNDGTVDWAEASTAIALTFPEFDNTNACRMAYEAADGNSDGLGWKETRKFFEYLLFFDDAWETFKSMDKDEDGLVTSSELTNQAYLLNLKATTDPAKVFVAMRAHGQQLKTASGEDAVDLRQVATWYGNKRAYAKDNASKADIARACSSANRWWGKSAAELVAMDEADVLANV